MLILKSILRRGMFSDLPQEEVVKVEEDAAATVPLLEFLYAERYMTFDQSKTLDLCRSLMVLAEKYDVPELCELCDGKLAALQLTFRNLPEAYALVVKNSLKAALASCQDYVDKDMLRSVERCSSSCRPVFLLLRFRMCMRRFRPRCTSGDAIC